MFSGHSLANKIHQTHKGNKCVCKLVLYVLLILEMLGLYFKSIWDQHGHSTWVQDGNFSGICLMPFIGEYDQYS